MKNSTRQMLAQGKQAWLPLAGLAALLAVWLGWSAYAQMRHEGRRAELEQVRDEGVRLLGVAIKAQHEKLARAVASPDVGTAAAGGDLAAAASAANEAWPNAKVEVLPIDLNAAYAELPKGGYGRLAVAEMALSSGKLTGWVVKSAGAPHYAMAAPIQAGGKVVGVAHAQVKLSELTGPLDTMAMVGDAYLGLRQGSVTVWTRGEAAYADAAERLARPIGTSGMRLVGGTDAPPAAAMGMQGMMAAIAALVFAGLAVMFVLLWRMKPGDTAVDDSPTLADVVATTPPAEAPAPVKVVVKEPSKAPQVLIDKGIFRAYDIRGVVGQSLDPSVAELIGHSIGSLMREQDLHDIVVGRDGRHSGASLVEGLTTGLRRAGVNVIDIGMVPTPVVYFGAYHLRTGCCVSVTGSHNPPDYNGFKIVVGGETLSGDAIQDLYARIGDGRLHTAEDMGSYGERDISADYVMRIASDVQLGRRLKVVVDAGNGVAGEIGPRVLEAIGAEVEELYCEIDGNFPNHHPDPSEPHNLRDLIDMVERFDADIGIAFDGDGDRLGVVTRDGQNIFPDRLLMLFAADVLERNPGAVIVYDVKCTGRLAGHILRHGGSPLMWKTGHSLIKSKMRETGAELAGEMSGHFFFAERWYGFDDGIYAAARLLEILATAVETPEELLNSLPTGVSTPEIKVDAPHGDPHGLVARFCEVAQFEGARVSTIDGLRADWPDGFGLVRASNTTPVLVMRFEADDDAALARVQGEFRQRLLQVDPTLVLPF